MCDHLPRERKSFVHPNFYLKYVESTEIKVYSSVPIQNPPTDLQSLIELLREFPKLMDKYNEGRGVPIQMLLSPLDDFDSTTDGKRKDR